MINKTYSFIVINKNNMKQIWHYSDIELVMSYMWGKKLKDIIIIVNEKELFLPDSVGTGDLQTIKHELRKKAGMGA